MDVGMLHTHHLMVALYFALLLTGAFVLGLGTPEQLDGFNRRARFGHMILGGLMLLTGGYLLVRSPVGLSAPSLVKYAIILLAIGLAVMGLRRRRIGLVIASLVSMVYVYGVSKTDSLTLQTPEQRVAHEWAQLSSADATARGEAVYRVACASCHGADGKAGFLKSKDLTTSTADSIYVAALLKNGKGLMPAFAQLTEEQRAAVTTYVLGLQKP